MSFDRRPVNLTEAAYDRLTEIKQVLESAKRRRVTYSEVVEGLMDASALKLLADVRAAKP